MFFKKEYSDFVDLSIGRVYFKPITNGMRNSIQTKSTIAGSTINQSFFFQLWDYKLTCLSNRKINNLSINDGDKLRQEVRIILIRHGILQEEKKVTKNSNWNAKDKAWFGEQEQAFKNRIGAK